MCNVRQYFARTNASERFEVVVRLHPRWDV
jgi:hypothetical protein